MESSTDVTIPETKILEINLISAQNLKIPSSATKRRRTMHTYALAWVDPNTKLRSDLDVVGGENPTWNDKFIFRVSQDFINGDTSAVQFQIYAVGYLRDYFIGTVRYILSSSPISSRSGDVIGIPGFSALHIRRPSGNVYGVLNIAATVYNSSDFPSLSGVSAICFRDLIGKNHQFREGRLSRCLSHVGSKRSEQSSESESVYFSDGTDSTVTTKTSNSSLCDSKTVTGFKDGNVVRSKLLMAGKKAWKSDGGSLLCGLVISPRRSKPLDQDQDQGLPSVKSKDDKIVGGD